MNSRTQSLWLGLALVALTVTAYGPALSAGFIWDDDQLVSENSLLRSGEGLRRIWLEPGAATQYYPMTFTSFWVEYHLWGLKPLGYHGVNILLHATSAVLAWLVLRRLAVPGAWVVAAVWALHPVMVESVVWVSERKNCLSGVFYLAALLAYLRFEEERKDWRVYGLGLGLFFCALLSKTVACTLPVVILLVMGWKRGKITRGDVLPLLPWFGAGVMLGLTTVYLEKYQVGARGADLEFSILERGLIAGRASWFYVSKLVWPGDLIFIYPRWKIDAGVWWQFLFPLGALVSVGALWGARVRLGRGPLVAVLCFLVTLSPALGFFAVYPMKFSFVADHFQYLASLALLALLVSAVVTATARWRTARYAFSVAILLALGGLTWNQELIYTDPETLWRDTAEMNPASSMAHANYGAALFAQQKYDEALVQFQIASQISPHDVALEVHLGNVYFVTGKTETATAHYREAIRLKPTAVTPHYNLAQALVKQGKYDEAIVEYQETLRLQTVGVPAVYNSWGIALAKQGKYAAAMIQFQEALRFDPAFEEAADNLRKAQANLKPEKKP